MNSPRSIGWQAVAVGVICLVFSVWAYRDAAALRDHGMISTATVTEVYDEGRSDFVVLEFVTADGRVIEAETSNYRWDPKPEIGDRASIVYDPRDPTGNVADVRNGPDFLAAWLFAAGAAVAAVLAPLSFRGLLRWGDQPAATRIRRRPRRR
ncbi:hypothetical protein GCM10009682_52580 [Luedemannella flava]|uniref:DUF3592 domain-containing protein n=1 Tax=Luedemannella flava TaxID=349316 RepID=A0ABP4YP85_9ACTN